MTNDELDSPIPTSGPDRLRRTSSMPRRATKTAYLDDAPVEETVDSKATPPKTDYFHCFNRAKSKLFHSVRMPRLKKPDNHWSNFFSKKTTDIQIPAAEQKHRESVISETGTIDTRISFGDDEKSYDYSSFSLSSTSPDHLNFSLDSNSSPCQTNMDYQQQDMPTPIPPPRRCPGIKTSARKLRPCVLSHNFQPTNLMTVEDTTSFEASPSSQGSCSSPFADEDYDDSYGDVRILPVVQNGVKMSDTHYWIINPPPSHRGARRFREFVSDSGNANVFTVCSHTDITREKLFSSSYSSRLLPSHQQYENVSVSSLYSSPGDRLEQTERQPVKLRRGRSELGQEHLRKYQSELVSKLRFLVPSATLNECEAVLIGSGWMFDVALRRLKLELVCRTGYASKPCCQRLLEMLNWNLDDSMEHIRAGKPVPSHRPPPKLYLTFDGAVPSIPEHSVILPTIFVGDNQLEQASSPASSGVDGQFTPETSPTISPPNFPQFT